MSPAAWLGRPTTSVRYLVYARAFAGASLIRLALPDALDHGLSVPNLAAASGAILLAVRGAIFGWVLSAAGLASALLLQEDQLTQSTYLLACAVGAVGCAAGSGEGRAWRLAHALPAIVRSLTVGLYLLAAVHKANRDFFDPAVSCATGGLHILAGNWSLPWLARPALDAFWPPLFIAVEALVVLLLVARPVLGMVLALTMHIPLTIVFAPSFAFVVMSGWVCLLQEEELVHLGRVLRRRWPWVLALGGSLGLGSFLLYLRDHWVVYPFWSGKEALLWMALVWLLFAIHDRPPGALGWLSGWREGPLPATRRAWTAILVGAFLANGLTPYLGLQFHHTGAMLSNLRIDRGCWNSALFPEAMRLRDPYVRIDSVRVGGNVRGPEVLEATIREGLRDPTELWRARGRWCEAGVAPLEVRGTYDGARFRVDDLCTDWPFREPWLPTVRRFQVNLLRECPQRCVH